MPINPRVFGPPTARVHSTGLERLGKANRPEFGGDISTDRLADEAAAFSAMQALPTFKRAGTDDIEPPEFDFDLDDEPIETPRGLRDPQASETPRAGLERLSRDEGPSDLNTAFGLAGTATGTAKRIAQGFDQLAPPTSFADALRMSDKLLGGAEGPSSYGDVDPALYDIQKRGEPGTAGGGFDIATGLTRIGEALTSDRGDVSKGLGTVAGGLQAYQGLSQATGAVPAVPYAGPIGAGLSAASGAADAENPEMGAAQSVMSLLRGGLSSLGPGGFGAATLFAPAFESIGSSIYDAFHEPSHEERETLEANKAIGAAKGMARDVQFATTPEELQAVIDRYGGGFGGHTIGADNWDPMAFEASIRAGVDPSFLTDANTRLSEIVRQQAQAIALAEQGHPEALAYLDRQRQAGQAFQDEISQLTGPWAGMAEPGLEPDLTAPNVLARLFGSDLENLRHVAAGQIFGTRLGEIAIPQEEIAAAVGIPALAGTVIPLLGRSDAEVEFGAPSPYAETPARLPDNITEWLGLPRGTVVPYAEYLRLQGDYNSGSA